MRHLTIQLHLTLFFDLPVTNKVPYINLPSYSYHNIILKPRSWLGPRQFPLYE